MVAQVVPELWGVPAMRHEGACASSSLAMLTAMAEIEAGRYDCVLVLGVEEFKNLPGDQASANQNAAAWQGREDIACTFMWPAAFGLLAAEYERRYGLDRQYLNRIAELNYGNARRNPLAQTRKWQFDALSFTDDDQANPVDGAGLAAPGLRPDHRRRLRRGAGLGAVCARTCETQRHDAAGSATHRRLGPPQCRAAPEGQARTQRHAPYVFPHVRQTIEDAWRRAGVPGIEAMDGVETHDCFTTTEYMAIDHLGLTATRAKLAGGGRRHVSNAAVVARST